MVVITANAVHMHRHARRLRKALQAVRHHLGAQLAQPLALEPEVDDAVGPVGEVDDGAREGFVEGCVGVAEAREAGRRAEGFGEGATEGDAAVFGGVMVVNCISSQ